ncbi:4'-phosphopantetheinyl transferase superfamily protein [Desulfococcaceae bacterium HSG8]|nr:4'-phosphopantetheinyl transferase superfamily protein [Desulfococcaceae bacterium HSG8]
MNCIHPIILPVPPKASCLSIREKVKYLSRYARRSIEISAEKSGYKIKTDDLSKDENGAPLPVRGIYWSVTHKPEYVGGVIALKRIGIDIEKIRPCSPRLFAKIGDDKEWALTDAAQLMVFFRYWTSKEAVLKAAGIGLRDLFKCRISEITDDRHLIITYRNKEWLIEHLYFNGHIASVLRNTPDVDWVVHRFVNSSPLF